MSIHRYILTKELSHPFKDKN